MGLDVCRLPRGTFNYMKKNTIHELMLINNHIQNSGVETNEVSDGYHTFGELYDHRIELFIQLCKIMSFVSPYSVWRSKRHSDGELAFGGTWFVLGIHKAEGKQVTYHLPIERWDDAPFAEILEKAPEFDGHTPADVLERLKTL